MATKKKNGKQALVKKGETALEEFYYGEDEAGGYEGQTSDDYMIPFIAILQKGSPQCDDDENFPTAKPGKIFNTASEDITDVLQFVPSLTQHVYVEWRPRDQRGGFVAVHELNSDVVKEAKARAKAENAPFGKYQTEDGNDLVETFYVYGITCEGDEPDTGVVIAFTSTKITPYKKWNTKMRSFQIKLKSGKKHQPPLFAHLINITTVKQENKHGAFYNFNIRPAKDNIRDSLLRPGDPRLEAAKDFGTLIKSGAARADYDKADGRGGGEGDDEEFEHF